MGNAAATLARLDGAGHRHHVAFPGGHVTWRRFGEGPPLVLLHGGHGSWLHWARNIDELSSRHTLWVPDMPGYGDSSPPVEPTLNALVDATKITLDKLVGPSTPIGLVGFSFGGLVAATMVVARGAVSQLALIGPGGHGGPRRPRGELHSWREAADRHDAAALAEVMRHNLTMHMLRHAESVDALALHIHTEACMRTRFHSKASSRGGSLAALLNAYRGPLLLAWGEHDVTAVPQEVALSLSDGRDGCRTHVVPRAGHWVQYEHADRLNSLLMAWLDETSSKDPTT